MHYDITVKDHRNYESLSLAEKVSLRKQVGNYYFSRTDFNKAARCYSNGVKLTEHHFSNRLDGVAPDAPVEQLLGSQEASQSREYNDEEKELLKLYVDTLNNLAACFLSLQQYLKAREACVRILEVEYSHTILRTS